MKEQLSTRFLHYQVTPPASAWEEIAELLEDHQRNKALAERVISVGIEPPAGIWQEIAQHLQQPSPVVKPFFSRPAASYFGRTAAVVAGIVLIGSVFLLFNNNRKTVRDREDLTANETTPAPSLPPGEQRKLPKKQLTAMLPKISTLYSAISLKKKIFTSSPRKLATAIVKEKDAIEAPAVSIPAKPIRDKNGEIINAMLTPTNGGKYLSVTGPNGEQTRISAKFASLLLYLNGDDDTDQNESVFTRPFLESLLWKSKFQSWRNTISQTAFIPSSTNFMDILEFKDLIQQQQDFN